MSLVISSSLVITEAGDDDIDDDNPIIGYDNVVPTFGASASSSDPDYPVVNLSNPATHLIWRSAASSPVIEETLTVDLTMVEPIDYLAIARHNFGSGQMPLTVQGNISTPAVWFDLSAETLLADDGPAIFRWTPQTLLGVRLVIGEGLIASPLTPELAVLYIGKLLYLQRRIYVGHTPQKYQRTLSLSSPMSINGAFLGRVVMGQKTDNTINLENLTATWYREYMDPFVVAAQEIPFFWAWRPGGYPREVAYAWMSGNPKVSNQRTNGMMQFACDLTGIAP